MSDPRNKIDIEVTNDMTEKTPRFEPRDWYPSSNVQELVRKFHVEVDEPVADKPQSIGPIRGFLRVDLIKNGLEDFEKAVNDDSLLGQYDALLEILHQTYGTLVEMGVDAAPGMREVMRSKMTMTNEVFEEPELFNVLTKQGWKPAYEEYLTHQNLKDPREVLEAMAGKPSFVEVVKLIPNENPEPDTQVEVKRGVHHNGLNYFNDETHAYSRRLYQNFCICGKLEVDRVHSVDWDIDNNEQVRKDNFHERVLSGWVPSEAEQILYEHHRQQLESIFPSTKVVNGELQHVFYYNGEKDVDWDFDTKAPRARKKD